MALKVTQITVLPVPSLNPVLFFYMDMLPAPVNVLFSLTPGCQGSNSLGTSFLLKEVFFLPVQVLQILPDPLIFCLNSCIRHHIGLAFHPSQPHRGGLLNRKSKVRTRPKTALSPSSTGCYFQSSHQKFNRKGMKGSHRAHSYQLLPNARLHPSPRASFSSLWASVRYSSVQDHPCG